MKKLLLEGYLFELSNEDDLAELFWSSTLNKFCIMFNANLRTFKSFGGFTKHMDKLKAKYDLISTKEPKITE